MSKRQSTVIKSAICTIKTHVHENVLLVMLRLYVCGSLSLWQHNQARSKGGVSGAGGERRGFLL